MRAPLSIVIPTLNAAHQLPGCAAALMEGVEAGLIREVIISDGGSVDATKEVSGDIGAHWLTGDASRGGQLRRGGAVAQGDWLLFLHADTQLSAGWAAAVASHMAGNRAGYFQLGFDQGGVRARWVAGWANVRARVLGLPYGDQGLLIPADLYRAVGEYADIPLMEDVAMARQLRGQLDPIAVTARTSAAKYVAEGWFRRGRRNLWCLARYLLGADPKRLAQSYRRSGPRS